MPDNTSATRGIRRGRRLGAVLLAALLVLATAGLINPGAASAADAELSLQKSQNHGPGPLSPGQSFAYTLQIGCSSLVAANCPQATITDVIPAGLDVEMPLPNVPGSTTRPTTRPPGP